MIKINQIKSFIEKIDILEKSIGKQTNYETMEPIDFDHYDIIAIQNVAKQIAE